MLKNINNLFVTLVSGILLLSLLAWHRKRSLDLEICRSSVDGQEYLVRKLPDAQIAADRLAQIKNLMLLLIGHLKRKAPENEAVQLLDKNFKPESLSEASKWTNGTSYSLNKGQQVVMCLRQKPNNHFVDLNTLVFVTLHEMAHLATKSVGHTPEFWENFKFFLKESIGLGIYDYQAYHDMPIEYCGTKIADTPLK